MFLLLDKPAGMTSHDVVDQVRKITSEKRVGHGGTLDPNATGLLIVGMGRESTKKLGEIARGMSKTYVAEIVLGEERDTDDVEGKVLAKARGVLPPSEKEVGKLLFGLHGEREQVPPKFSAIKIKGKRAYQLAREGNKFNLKPRKITIYRINLLRYNYPYLKIKVEVSSGTYIRALARDIGKQLGVGAYLADLRRTRIGKFSVQNAVSLDKLTKNNWSRYTYTKQIFEV